jgi:hypothetical protein
MPDAPSLPLLPAPPEGRTPNGRFAQGNQLAKGNPNDKRMFDLKRIALGAVSDDDMRGIIGAMVREAKAGDVAAARPVREFTLGKAPVQVKLDLEDRESGPVVDLEL